MRHILPSRLAAARLTRGLWPDRNPLRRATDRTEAALLAGLLAVFLAGAPVTAVTAWRWAGAAGLRTERAERASWHHVLAVLLQDSPGLVSSQYGTVESLVLARWDAPGGLTRTGLVSVDITAPAGSTVVIWTDAAGRPTGQAPLSPYQVAQQAELAAMTAPVILAVVLLIGGALGRHALNRRRLAAWDADWHVTGPLWTSRR